jgi:hypothetical protein
LLLVLSEQGKDDTISFSQERLADMLGLRRCGHLAQRK